MGNDDSLEAVSSHQRFAIVDQIGGAYASVVQLA
jgi:hypothetical protein